MSAPNLVNLETVSKAYPDQVILDSVSLGIAAGQRVGVVGRNGDGKSTLLRLIARADEPDSGRVVHTGGTRLAVLGQTDALDDARSVHEALFGDAEAHEWASSARVREILTGLFGGLDAPALPEGLDSRIGVLSGGERRRVDLARVLTGSVDGRLPAGAEPADLLLLDEPTNHLDIEGIAWLASHLNATRSAIVVVTHDRWFLDEICSNVWDVQRGNVFEYEGGYSAYVLARAERERQANVAEEKRQNLMRKELAWLRRGPKARTSKAKFRVDAANELIANEPPPRDTAELVSFATGRLGKTVFEARDVTVKAGDQTLLEHLDWILGPGKRIGLLGVNGAGKTSLLRTLAEAIDEKQPAAGRIKVGRTVKLAWLTQHMEDLDASWRVLEAIEMVAKRVQLGKKEMTAGQLAERLGFVGGRQRTFVRDLSGGQRRRLQLARLLMAEPNVLFLDEPTNDLDIETLTQLEDLLDDWAGTMVVVSHDRYFTERVADETWALLGDRSLRMLPRGVEEYLERRAASEKPVAVQAKSSGAAPVKSAAAVDRATQKELSKLERRLEKVEERIAGVHGEMAEFATDPGKLSELQDRLSALETERDEIEERWMELAD
ncbi:ABC-F family ATP-binding cassette domain-containing protein [Glycomyces sp. NRRL B-16210]|uniref:ABC-F family ATP-binding cassette domain-containing protein n=1 Tax=Glycomyces sp. NRRL B-16210 TaxID=1463821 RepID=UPI0004BFB235|nr:ABC-F family ATP-binding cassette domain-containing protein [Glycomyces sp. NRRL B-16210]